MLFVAIFIAIVANVVANAAPSCRWVFKWWSLMRTSFNCHGGKMKWQPRWLGKCTKGRE